MERKRRDKLRDKKTRTLWRVWKREAVVVLWLRTLLELELDRFILKFFEIFSFFE